jgi:hypothetical protein
MITATEIRVERAEGPTALCVERSFKGPNCWQDANTWLVGQSHTYPKTGGYDKHDFKVTFEDGETYEGRLDCQHPSCDNPDLNVARHVRDFVEFLAGTRRPAHMKPEVYQRYLDTDPKGVAGAREFLATYDIP